MSQSNCIKSFILLLFVVYGCTAISVTQNVGIGLVYPVDGTLPTLEFYLLPTLFINRQYSPVQWWNEATNNQIKLNLNVATNQDMFEIYLQGSGNTCDEWRNLCLNAFKRAGGTATSYSSFMWIFPDRYALSGCSQTDSSAHIVIPQVGPCNGGCHNIFLGTPPINTFIFALGRNLGLARSHARRASDGVVIPNADWGCQMGSILTFDGAQRRGFNAVKLMQLGLITARQIEFGQITQFLAATYEYRSEVANPIKLLRLGTSNFYLSYRALIDSGVDQQANLGTPFVPTGQSALTGQTLVHLLNSDGSTTLYAGIPSGTSYNVPGTNFVVRQSWNVNNGAMLSISTTGTLLADPIKPSDTIPAAGFVETAVALLDTAQQSSYANQVYSSTAQLNLVWAGDDRNNSAFIRVAVKVPRASAISKATLILVTDVQQLEFAAGRTSISVGIENVDNAQVISGDAIHRNSYIPRFDTQLRGDWYPFDDVRIDVTSLIQSFVNRPKFTGGNFANFIITGAIANQQNTRTVKSGQACGNVAGVTPCGPRIQIDYTGSGGGLPAPVDCQFTYSVWSICSGGNCGATGTQTRDLLILSQPSNGGAACPTETRQTRTCAMDACVPQPKDCVWQWGAYSTCSGPCSSFGVQTRNIIIISLPENGGLPCPTVQTETRYDCQTVACPPINCVVDFSSNWGTCVGICGQTGSQTRTGTIITNPQYGGTACPSLTQTQSCQMPPCDQNCVVTFGADWGVCVGTCGTIGQQSITGTVTQQKIGNGLDCEPLIRYRTCLPDCPNTNCVFTWEPWSVCIGSGCGVTGYRFRNPFISVGAQGEGTPCPNQQSETCYTGDCAVASSVTHIASERSNAGTVVNSFLKLRDVDNQYEIVTESSFRIDQTWKFENVPASTVWELQTTMGVQNIQGRILRFSASTDNVNFQSFLDVSSGGMATYRANVPFSASTTAPQIYIRVRNTIEDYRPSLTAALFDRVVINGYAGIPPKIDCVQSNWVTSPCSQSCGIGTQTLTRTVLQPAANGGVPCGDASKTQTCSEFTKCPSDCVFGPWVSEGCNRDCGVGSATSTRIIVQQAQNGGASCSSLGGTTKTVSCNLGNCIAGNCIWGAWSAFSACSATCGGGTKTQTRQIQTLQSAGGLPCSGPSVRSVSCNQNLCPGAAVTMTATSLTQTDPLTNTIYQSWGGRVFTIPGLNGVTLHLNERVTDTTSSIPANGSWQIVNTATTDCVARSIALACPTGTTTVATNIAGFVGKLTCTNSVGKGSSPITVVFTITCA